MKALLSKLLGSSVPDSYFVAALAEVREKRIVEPTFARAMAHCDGTEGSAIALYIRYRGQELMDAARNSGVNEAKQKAEEELKRKARRLLDWAAFVSRYPQIPDFAHDGVVLFNRHCRGEDVSHSYQVLCDRQRKSRDYLYGALVCCFVIFIGGLLYAQYFKGMTPRVPATGPGDSTIERGALGEEWKRLRLGMTESEVVTALGEPKTKAQFTWVYADGGYVNFHTDSTVLGWMAPH